MLNSLFLLISFDIVSPPLFASLPSCRPFDYPSFRAPPSVPSFSSSFSILFSSLLLFSSSFSLLRSPISLPLPRHFPFPRPLPPPLLANSIFLRAMSSHRPRHFIREKTTWRNRTVSGQEKQYTTQTPAVARKRYCGQVATSQKQTFRSNGFSVRASLNSWRTALTCLYKTLDGGLLVSHHNDDLADTIGLRRVSLMLTFGRTVTVAGPKLSLMQVVAAPQKLLASNMRQTHEEWPHPAFLFHLCSTDSIQ